MNLFAQNTFNVSYPEREKEREREREKFIIMVTVFIILLLLKKLYYNNNNNIITCIVYYDDTYKSRHRWGTGSPYKEYTEMTIKLLLHTYI